MKNTKAIGLLLSLAIILSVTIPGTLALSTDTEESKSEVTLGETPSTNTELPADPELPAEGEKTCTCGNVDGTHTDECPLSQLPDETDPNAEPDTGEKECTCGNNDGTHASECPLSQQHEETIPNDVFATEEKECTCGSTDGTHSEECPLYIEPDAPLFERLMAATSVEEFDEIAEHATEEELGSFTCKEFDELDAYYIYLSTGEYPDYSIVVDQVVEIVNFTNVAPFVDSDK